MVPTSARIHTSPAVSAALAEGRAVVALETAVLTHGLPRDPQQALGAADLDEPIGPPGVPLHLRVLRGMERAVSDAGAVPATIGVLDGRLVIGLEPDEIERLALDPDATKASAPGLAASMASSRSSGTTVSATLAACRLAHPAPIRVLATGGLGGVHRGWQTLPDCSADLTALARVPTAVVCSGIKSILDVPATVEVLEGLGVPLVGIGTRDLPLFNARGDGRVRLEARVDSPAEAALLCRVRWFDLRQEGAVILALPAPDRHALDPDDLERDLEAIESSGETVPRRGAQRTPAFLEALAERTRGASLRANVALLLANAAWAACLASDAALGVRTPGLSGRGGPP